MTDHRYTSGRQAILWAAAAGIAWATLPWVAQAHSGLITTTPAADAELVTPPREVVLVFTEELHPDGSRFTVTDAGGSTVGAGQLDLAVADRNELRGAVEIVTSGRFTVAWTSVAADGHTERGEFSFEYVAENAGAVPPNTALPATPSGPVVAVLGGLVVLTALLFRIWSRAR